MATKMTATEITERINKALDKIEKKEGHIPYSAWVYSTTYQNGRHQVFKNTNEQNPF